MAPLVQARLDRICIVMMSALGDAVHTLPVVCAIKRQHPNAHITWLLQPGPALLARGHAGVDEIILFDRKRGWRAFEDMRRELAKRRFDLVLALQVYFKAGLITAMANAPVKLGFDRARARDLNWLFTTHRIPARPIQHVQDQYFEFLDALGIPSEPVEWGMGPYSYEREWQRDFFNQFDRPIASLVVATSRAEKDWPADRWAEICDVLYFDYGLQPVIVGSRSARELEGERVVMEQSRAPVISTLGQPMREMVCTLEGSALAITPDTGPMHISVALGTPVVSLFGYTNPKRTGPYRRFHDLIVDKYGEPGEDYVPTMEHRAGHMDRILAQDVIERLEVWKERYAPESTRKFPGNS